MNPESLPKDGNLRGATMRAAMGTSTCAVRPALHRSFFGGRFAQSLEDAGEGAIAAQSIDEIVALLGNDYRACSNGCSVAATEPAAHALLFAARRWAVQVRWLRRLDANVASCTMAAAEYRALAAWLFARASRCWCREVPAARDRRRYLEDQGGCDEADYLSAGRRHGRCDRAAAGFLRSSLLSAGWHDHCRAFGRCMGCAGARAAGLARCLASLPSRPRGGHATSSQPGLRAAQAISSAADRQGARPVTWLARPTTATLAGVAALAVRSCSGK